VLRGCGVWGPNTPRPPPLHRRPTPPPGGAGGGGGGLRWQCCGAVVLFLGAKGRPRVILEGLVDAQALIAVAFPVPARAPERTGDRGAAIQKVLALRQACLISASSGTGRKPRARR
jgi:hypothetical protein